MKKLLYLVNTTGLTGTTQYEAHNPDEALMFAYRFERYLRLKTKRPNMDDEKILELVKTDSDIDNFRINSCILEEGD